MRCLLVISIALAVGCRDTELQRLESIRDEVCRCETPACGEEALKKVGEAEVASTQRSQRVARDMMDCLARLYAEDRPATGPDTEAPPDDPGPSAVSDPAAP